MYVLLSISKSQLCYISGITGEAGAPGLPGVDSILSRSNGVVYTRWGQTVCRDDSTLVYAGS